MKFSIVGSGNMAQGIGTRVVAGGHELTIFDRDEIKAKGLAEQLGATGKKLGEKIESEIVILALPYQAIFEVVDQYEELFSDKILVDISNPVNLQTFELTPPPGSSGTEEIAKSFHKKVILVKAFNTTFAGTLIKGKIQEKKLDVFIASDDENAARVLVKIVMDGGMRGLFVGPLKRASFQLIHMTLQESWEAITKVQ